MAIFVYDGRRCPALFLSGANPDGSPLRAVYWYFSTEGDGKVEQRETASLVAVPGDDGASWSASSYPTGAHFYLIVPDDSNLQTVSNRLNAAYVNRERAAAEARALNEPQNVGDTQPLEEQGSNLEDWQKLKFASKEDWKRAGKPRA